jgi:hypothetical protein
MYLNEEIQKLCRQVSQEKDQDKLLSLVNQLTNKLDQASKSENPSKPGTKPDDSTEKLSGGSSHESGKKPDAA